MAFRNLRRAGVLAAIAAGFLLWHFPLLTADGRVRGFNSDAAILGLMGKKILEGRGFDVFFWGQNYIGPLTSMITAAWGSMTGGANPLALRLATLTEAILGTFFIWLGIARIDARAASTTAAALVLTPPVLLRMMITPLGAEMAFLMSAALFAVLMQHLTADEGRGWLSRPGGQIAFGALAGVSWWMNQQVVFTLIAGMLVLALQSAVGRRFWSALRLRDRLLLRGATLGWRSMPGVVEALGWVLMALGAFLLFAYFVLDLAGAPRLPFVVGGAADGLILFLLPHLLLPAVFGEWRRWGWRPSAEETSEIAAAIRFAAGVGIGYAPVWLGAMAGWYERSYVFGFRPIYPSELPAQARSLIEVVPHWIGMMRNPVGGAYALALAVFVVAGLRATRTRSRLFVAAIPIVNCAFYVAAPGVKAHYLISSVGMLFGLAALGAMHLWDRRKSRPAIIAAGVVAALSIAATSQAMHGDVLNEPDPLPLLERVRGQECQVVYADFWIAYRYRFLDGERSAWIPYLSQNRTRKESLEYQKLPGQRCLVRNDGSVERIAGDPPLFNPPERPSASLPPVRPPEAR